MSRKIVNLGILKNVYLNVIGYKTVLGCLNILHADHKTDNQLAYIMECFLNEKNIIAENSTISFYELPNGFEIDYDPEDMFDGVENQIFNEENLKEHIVFIFVNFAIALTKEIAADVVSNFCIQNAINKETLRLLYEQIREKYDIAYPHVV